MTKQMVNIGRLIKRAEVSLVRQMNDFARQNGLTGTQMNIIDYLSRQEKMAADQKAIENEFNIRRSTTTIVLQRMEKRQLVQRIIDPRDRRRRQVQLTDNARQLIPEVHAYINGQEQRLRKHFSEGELAAVTRVLQYIEEEDRI
ncbi:MarR family winged helix-turn-helix transcriptional regulator [Limosilactobacillus sp.]|uniref:MarR family winged helix-turn-helix transcriptional regulator n=1 Tax=Limosilactobacillus sp. TaxID=2773925 RepID=UPI003F0F977B